MRLAWVGRKHCARGSQQQPLYDVGGDACIRFSKEFLNPTSFCVETSKGVTHEYSVSGAIPFIAKAILFQLMFLFSRLMITRDTVVTCANCS